MPTQRIERRRIRTSVSKQLGRDRPQNVRVLTHLHGREGEAERLCLPYQLLKFAVSDAAGARSSQ
jgi:hypothetical protein